MFMRWTDERLHTRITGSNTLELEFISEARKISKGLNHQWIVVTSVILNNVIQLESIIQTP